MVAFSDDRKALISELAEDVWNTYSKELRVDLDGIANAVEISISYGDYGDAFDGLLEHYRGSFHIFCNSGRGQPVGSPRARFTVAHELGHYFVDEHRNALMMGNSPHYSFPEQQTDNPVEMEANHFAASLLMPTTAFKKYVNAASRGLQGVVDTASTFGVSVQSAALRYVAIAEKNCAIVMFREDKKPWYSVSPRLQDSGFSKLQKRGIESIPENTATWLSHKDQPTVLGTVYKTGTVGSAWFAGIYQGGQKDLLFEEYAIRLGNRGVLVFLELLERLPTFN